MSKGHIEIIGRFEYFYGANGDLFRAPADSPLDVWGYRMGARFESSPHCAERTLQFAQEAVAKWGP